MSGARFKRGATTADDAAMGAEVRGAMAAIDAAMGAEVRGATAAIDAALGSSAILREAAPRAPIHVVKLGGRSLDSGDAALQLAKEAASFPERLVFVHGGGAEVSAWSRRLGIEPQFVNGLRVTDAGTLEVAVAVLAGLANKRLTASLRGVGVNAAGLAALDGGVLQVARSRDPRLGAVGRIVSVDPRIISMLLDSGFTPVVASIACVDGDLMNVNADDVAAALAAALGAESLTLLSDVPGLQLNGCHVPDLTADGIREALRSRDVTGGMIPKLEAALGALSGGVSRVHLGAWAGDGTLASLRNGFPSATTCRAAAPSEPSCPSLAGSRHENQSTLMETATSRPASAGKESKI